jgi:hypothetical protein
MPIEIVYEIRDRRNKKATTSVRIVDATEAQTDAFANAWADAIDNLIGGVIRAASALIGVDISGLSSNVASSTSDVEEIAEFDFRTAAGNKVLVTIPAILETLVDNDTGELNQAAPAVAAFIAMMEDGITAGGTLVQPCDVGNEDIVSTRYARERSRNSGTSKGD